ncbi:MAG: outer membrane lipoprotein-sorting protein [Bacillota bacterium]|nr:outer membrane lipoprotein-sorting protein [Bacillota bacterium]HPZ55047.1 outer membrane lipoprotein-sorting protein [Bacillota bacterium]HQD19017.1 outer membrane lipoprotein-sorting protein [Bacillota bacterium]
MRRHRVLVILVLAAIMLMEACAVGAAAELTAEEIIRYRDDNEYFESARFEAEMVIVSGSRQMVKTMTSYVQEDNGLVVFTNPRDRGTKFLKRGDDLWMFFPDAEDLVKISGHMLNQGIMGSDFSYQDVMEADKLTDLYAFELVGEEELDGRPCYVLEGIAVEGQDVSYYRRKSWIDSERFVGLREELYAKSGRLLKVMRVTRVEELQGRWYPMESVMEDQLRKNTRTEFVVRSIEFDPEIPEGTFTLENLR